MTVSVLPQIPKGRGMFSILDSGNSMTTDRIVERIIEHRLDFELRNNKKEKKEKAAFAAYVNAKKEGKMTIGQVKVD